MNQLDTEVRQITIEKLNELILINSKRVSNLQEEIQKIQKSNIKFGQSKSEIDIRRSTITRLFKENQIIIRLKNILINEGIESAKQVLPNYDETLRQTLSGKLSFNRYHPYFNDVDFYEDLLNLYIESENYEKCDELRKTKQI